MKVKELIALLEADGWYQVRMKGSHRQFHHQTKPGTVWYTEWRPDQAGLKKQER